MAGGFAYGVKMAWIFGTWSYVFAHFERTRRYAAFLRHLMLEVQPFYVPALAVYWADLIARDVFSPLVTGGLIGMDLFVYLLLREKDDGRWKRRRRKIIEKVRRIGSRLIVIPHLSGA